MTLPFASCGSLGVPRPWPLSPVAAETFGARWDTGDSGTARVVFWQGGIQSRDRDTEKER